MIGKSRNKKRHVNFSSNLNVTSNNKKCYCCQVSAKNYFLLRRRTDLLIYETRTKVLYDTQPMTIRSPLVN